MAGKYQKSRIASSRKRETKDSATPSATPEPVAKRAKIDKSTPSKKADAKRIKIEQLTPSKKASTSVVHPSPSAARKAWIKDGQVDLDEPAQDLKANYLKYIHPEALSLFKQVEVSRTPLRCADSLGSNRLSHRYNRILVDLFRVSAQVTACASPCALETRM